MPKVLIARGGKAPYALAGTAQELFGEDLSDFSEITISGEVEDTGKNFVVSGQISCIKSFTCDRCLAEAKAAQVHHFAEEFSKSQVVDELIDVTELLRDELLAAQPMKNLCRADCKGLCPKCGKNLNEGSCACDTFITDPRLAALENFKLKDV